jgi:transketolase
MLQMDTTTQDENAVRCRRLANAVRMLAVDAVERAKIGHPGAPMGLADIAEALWRRYLKYDPTDPDWPDRDRLVLSNGHASMLLYAVLHLTGYDLSIDEIRRFRQLHSKTPGQPERHVTPGVETTTGPLGQGLANAVGMAIAERLLAQQFNRPEHTIVCHRTYCIVGDGCLMEGISHEACSLAGTLGLDKLIVLYDDNGISIDGAVKGWFADDTPARLEAYGWRVIRDVDGHDVKSIETALQAARRSEGKPTLVCCKTVIGWGAPRKAGTEEVHGAPLGAEEVAATRKALDWPYGPFDIPDDIRQAWDTRAKGAEASAEWKRRFDAYAAAYPELATEFSRRIAGKLPANFAERAVPIVAEASGLVDALATRKASQIVIEAFAKVLPELLGGSADLTGSNLTAWKASRDVGHDRAGNYIHYGVREFGMTAILNGITLHGGFLAYGGTFLVFSDYARNALRLAALMRIRLIVVLTHDSIGLGEDGPTHQPVEHLASLRLVPHMDVWRPCDLMETAVAWQAAIERADGPCCLVMTRQSVPQRQGDGRDNRDRSERVRKGGYVLADAPGGKPQICLIATGSEVALAMQARDALAADGVATRVVSMPCTSVFDRQHAVYRDAVLPRNVRRVAIEAGVTDYWRKYVGLDGAVIGLDRFGESAPGPVLFEHFGFTVERVVAAARDRN